MCGKLRKSGQWRRCRHPGPGWRPLPVSAGGARPASRWQSGPRTPTCRCSRLQDAGWSFGGPRLPLDLPPHPRKAAADGWRCVSHAVRKTYRGVPALCRRHRPREHLSCCPPADVPVTACASILPFSAPFAPVGFGEGPSIQGCGHPGPENRRPAAGRSFLQLPCPPRAPGLVCVAEAPRRTGTVW